MIAAWQPSSYERVVKSFKEVEVFYRYLTQTQWLIKTREGYNRKPILHPVLVALIFTLKYVH